MTNAVKQPPSTLGTLLKALEGSVGQPAATRRGQTGARSEAFANLLARGESRAASAGAGAARARLRDAEKALNGKSQDVGATPELEDAKQQLSRLRSSKTGINDASDPLNQLTDATASTTASPDAIRLDGSLPVAAVVMTDVTAPKHAARFEAADRVLVSPPDQELTAIDPTQEGLSARSAAEPQSDATALAAMRAASVAVERVETHHAPTLAIDGLRALARLQSRQSQSEQPTAVVPGSIKDGADVAATRDPEDRTNVEPHDASARGEDRPKLEQRWRPERRGDMFGNASSRHGWEPVAPSRSDAVVDTVRQEAFRISDVPSPSGLVGAAIGTGLLAAIKAADAPAAPTAVADLGAQPDVPTGGPVKSIELTMQPGQLGPIEVRMRLENGSLTISMKAASREDAAALAIERDAIEETLRSNGYAIDAITVSIAGEPVMRSEASASVSQNPQQQAGSSFDARDLASGTGSGERDGRSSGGHDGTAGRRGDNSSPATPVRPTPRNGVYV